MSGVLDLVGDQSLLVDLDGLVFAWLHHTSWLSLKLYVLELPPLLSTMFVCYSLPLSPIPCGTSYCPLSAASRTLVTMLALWSSLSTIVCAGLVSQITLANPLPKADDYSPHYAPDRLGAVASESSICSNIGIELLKQGGNAADAVSPHRKIVTSYSCF